MSERSTKRLVVLGATGHFGERICRRIAADPKLELIVTSRNSERASRVAEAFAGASGRPVDSAALDQTAPRFVDDLAALEPDIVIHTAGPYQGQSYRVAEACISCRAHYIDLADGREFVEGIGILHDEAVRNEVLVVSGASTLPGLSSAVVNEYRERFEQIDEVEISIAPAHQTPRGEATVRAVLSYCGKPFRTVVDGKTVTRYGWQHLRVIDYPSLGKRLGAVCDVPDLALMLNYVEGVKTVEFYAALEARWEQIGLWAMAWLTRGKIVKDWQPLAGLFGSVSRRLIKLGSDRGGMQLLLRGRERSGEELSLRWDLTAENNHGPEIPCTPALVIARKLAADKIDLRGACPCLGLVTLRDFEEEVSDLDISWSVTAER